MVNNFTDEHRATLTTEGDNDEDVKRLIEAARQKYAITIPGKFQTDQHDFHITDINDDQHPDTTPKPLMSELSTTRLEEIASIVGLHSQYPSQQRDFNNSKQNPKTEATKKLWLQKKIRLKMIERQRVIIRMLLVIFVVIVCCWLPLALNFVIDKNGRSPSAIYVLLTIIAWANSCVNVFIYAGMNPQFREAYIDLCFKSK